MPGDGGHWSSASEWDTGVRRGPPASVIRHQGQTRAMLERLRHVPREGSTPFPPRPSEDSLFTPPDGGWIWVLMNAILRDPLEAAEQQSPSARLTAVYHPTMTQNNNTLHMIFKKGNTVLYVYNFTLIWFFFPHLVEDRNATYPHEYWIYCSRDWLLLQLTDLRHFSKQTSHI